jgi:hypothetical protein
MISGGSYEGIDQSRSFGCVVCTREHVILSANGNGTNGVLNQIIIYLKATIDQVPFQSWPHANGIVDRLAD